MEGSMEQGHDTLRNEIEQFWNQVYSVSATLKTLAEQLRAAREANRKLESQVEAQRHQLEAQELTIRTLEDRTQQIETVRLELSNAYARIDVLQRTLSEREQIMIQREQELERVHSLRTELGSLQQRYAEIAEEYRAAQEKLQSMSVLENELERLRERIAELEQSNLRSIAEKEELAYLRSTVEHLRSAYERAQEQLSQQLEPLEEIQTLRNIVSKAEETIAQYQIELEQKNAELTQLRRMLEHTEHVNADSAEELSFERRDRLEEELHTVRTEKERLHQQCLLFERKVEQLQSIIAQRDEQLRELQQTFNELTEQRRKERETLMSELDALREATRSRQFSEQDVELHVSKAVEPLRAELEAAEKQRIHLQEQLATQREHISKLDDELRTERERNIFLTRQLRQSELNELETPILHLLEQLKQVALLLESSQSKDSENDTSEHLHKIKALTNEIRKFFQPLIHTQDNLSIQEALRQSRQLLEERLWQSTRS